jgi:2'-5' RNA ligase
MWETGNRFDAVKAAELSLLDSAVRRDPDRVRALLHPKFVEIGRSGRRWTRSATIAALKSEHERVAPETDEWLFNEVSPSLVLVTYRITGGAGSSRHASLWDVGGAIPMMRYHQGTLIRSDEIERFCVVALFGPIDVGERFQRREWPAHVTLASNFVTADTAERVIEAVKEANVVDQPLTFRFGRLAQFGPHRDITVRLAESVHSRGVHHALALRLGGLRGFAEEHPAHWRDGYHPHLTLRAKAGVNASEGEIRAASHVAVARLWKSEAEVVASFKLPAPDRPEIVCICGSARFLRQMRDVNRDLTLSGAIVLAPGEAEGVISAEQKSVLDVLHLRKIDLADRVLVVNPGGYVGESTRREIAYARAAGKSVSFTDHT